MTGDSGDGRPSPSPCEFSPFLRDEWDTIARLKKYTRKNLKISDGSNKSKNAEKRAKGGQTMLDKDTSGVLVMGRTQTSATILHSIFRDKTVRASDNVCRNPLEGYRLHEKYISEKIMALVIGIPKRPTGLISSPLTKVFLGSSSALLLAGNISSEYIVQKFWILQLLEIIDMIQLLIRNGGLSLFLRVLKKTNESHRLRRFPLDLTWLVVALQKTALVYTFNAEKMTLSNVVEVLEQIHSLPSCYPSELPKLNLLAPLPLHMKESWHILNYKQETLL